MGFENTVSEGIISCKDRKIDGYNLIQISAPIDYGSSGGALFSMRGKLIGILCEGINASNANLNFAISSNKVTNFLKSLNLKENY